MVLIVLLKYNKAQSTMPHAASKQQANLLLIFCAKKPKQIPDTRPRPQAKSGVGVRVRTVGSTLDSNWEGVNRVTAQT
jgi:hypothetical protein